MKPRQKLEKELMVLSDPIRAQHSARYFKTGPGEYGEGDVFLGIKTPDQRRVVKKYRHLPLSELKKLLASPIHNFRAAALEILVWQYQKEEKEKAKKKIVDFYLDHTQGIDNWDLVDISVAKILGDYLLDKDRQVLYRLVGSKNLWERRMAIIATAAFIREGDFKDTFKISQLLLKDEHDLIHKAVGWMLREVGKKDQSKLEAFLKKHLKKMPRTMLRYAIERFVEKKRQAYLQGRV